MDEVSALVYEDPKAQKACGLCKELDIAVGERTPYGAAVIYKTNGWFATLSPKTGGNPNEDFTIQLISKKHLTHFSQLVRFPKLSKEYGLLFSKVSWAMAMIMAEDKKLKAAAGTREEGIPIAVYGKCTTWKEKKEHLHIKIYQFRGALGQPAAVDSSFGRKGIEHDNTGNFVRMKPVAKNQYLKSGLIIFRAG